jgi:DNA mismatch repair protein MutL
MDTVTPNQTFFKSMTAQEYKSQSTDAPTLRSTAQVGYQSAITPWQAATSRNAAQLLARQKEREQARREQLQKQARDVQTVMEALHLQESGRVVPAPQPISEELHWAAEPAQPLSVEETPAPQPEAAKAETPPEQVLTTAEESPVTPDTPRWRIAGEVLNTYIIVEQGDTITFIGKHAAHERMNFDRMKAEDYTPMSQVLMTPAVVKLDPAESEVLLAHLELLSSFGFEAEDFGGGDILLREVPDYIAADEADRVLGELAEQLLSTGTANPEAARDSVLHTMACKAAIKGGWKNGAEELEAVAQAVMSGQVRYCPHGRPVAIEMTRKQMEKQFGRIQS